MPVGDEGRCIVLFLLFRRACGLRWREKWWEGEKVAAAGWSRGDECEDLGDEALLDCCVLHISNQCQHRSENRKRDMHQLGVKLGQPWLTVVIEDQDCVDHLAEGISSILPSFHRRNQAKNWYQVKSQV